MGAIRTARERARAELTREIKAAARRQLGESGAQALSLRAVARELEMASSALYRYFPSRDDLLTALILDAYEAIGDRVEAIDRVKRPDDHRGRFRAFCQAIRHWAQENPHEYSLIFGSPVPGYVAPVATVAQAARIPLTLTGIVRDAWAAGALRPGTVAEMSDELAGQSAKVAELAAPGVPGPVVACTVIAWTQLFGMVGFELYGHLNGTMEPAGPFFEYAVERMADLIGLPTEQQKTSVA